MITVPHFERSPYPYILLSSLFIGGLVSCLLMRKDMIKKEHIALIELLNLVCTVLMSMLFAGTNFFKIGTLGFDGVGGAVGLVGGTVTSCFIFKDRWKSILSSCMVPAPLMYSLAKIGCLLAGCCRGFEYDGWFSIIYGGKSFFPAQPTDFAVFFIVFLTVLIMKLRSWDGKKVALMVIIEAGIARFLTDFLRLSHEGKVLSFRQIVIIFAIGIAIIFNMILAKKNKEKDNG